MYCSTAFSIFFIVTLGWATKFGSLGYSFNKKPLVLVTNTAMVEATVEMLYVFPKNMIEHKAKPKNIKIRTP